MQRKDYLDKQIDQLGRVLAKMLAEFTGLPSPDADTLQNADAVLKNELGYDTDEWIAVPESEFVETLLATGKFNSANLEALADWLWWRANQTESLPLKTNIARKCLLLYEYIDHTDRIFSADRQAKMTQIRQWLAER